MGLLSFFSYSFFMIEQSVDFICYTFLIYQKEEKKKKKKLTISCTHLLNSLKCFSFCYLQ